MCLYIFIYEVPPRMQAIQEMASLGSLQGRFAWICGEELDLRSVCVQRSLIDVLNILFLVIYCLGLLLASIRREHMHTDRNRSRRWDSIVVSFLCAATSIAYLSTGVLVLFTDSHIFMVWERVMVFLRAVIWIGLAISLNVQPTKCLRMVAPIWWSSFSLLTTALNVEILLKDQSLHVLDMISWCVSFLLLFCTVRLIVRDVLHQKSPSDGFSEPLLIKKNDKGVELSKANFFSYLTFSWLKPLLGLGYSKPLGLSDIPPLDSEDGALLAYETFAKVWDLQRRDRPKTSNMVLFALAKCYIKEMSLVGGYAILRTTSVSASPILLYNFVQYSYRKEKDLSIGISLVVCLIVVKLVDSLSQRHWFFGSRRCGMRMRSALMAAIFQKQLKLSSLGRRNHSSGEIVNYIAVDAYRLGDFPWWFHMAWCLPLQLCFAVAILFGAVGWGVLPGLVPLVTCGFLNIPFAKILQGYQSKFMVAQDERLRATSAVLNNMKIIKLQSWEESFRNMIQSLRDIEFKWLAEIQMKKSYGTALYWMSPTVVSAVIFAGTAIMGTAPLNASTIFTVLATLRIMSEPVRMLPEVLMVMIQVKVSLDRIGVFLLEDEIKEEVVGRNPSEDTDLSIRVQNGVFSWDPSIDITTLKNINLSVSRGQKIAICGPVGAGKSSLLCAILGEIPKISGSVHVFGSIAYVSQTSWIQSGTIRDNILFGRPMDKLSYERAIRACALDKDIENFVHGDLTEIGQRGLNMSGGQKQRIQLARAVYNDADIYLLDDPFSAVDAHTAAILFHDCVMSALEKKIVILVTHQIEFLGETERILVMENGRVTQTGSYEELLKSGTAFEQLVNAHQSAMTIVDSVHHEPRGQTKRTAEDHLELSGVQPLSRPSENEISTVAASSIQLTEDEEKEIGNVGWKPYKHYFNVSKGYFLLASVIFAQFAFIILQMLATYWLALAVQIQNIGGGILVGVYATASILSCLFVYARSLFIARLGLRASKAFFSCFMDSVFKASMLFFDSTPVGRILTRASSDMSILDFDIPYSMVFSLAGLMEAPTIIVIMATVTWQVLIVAIPAMFIIAYVQRYYLASARELVRINGTTKAPVMNYMGETILGVVTIRAFAAMDRFIHTNLQLIDTDATLFFHTVAALEWVLLRVEALQHLIILTSALFLVLSPQGTIAPGFVGLTLSYALTLSDSQVFLTRWYSNLENYIISVERIKQYMHIPPEPPAVIDEYRPPPSWPQEGRVDFQALKVKYRPTAPFVLKGITCSVASGHKVGVVGRTGSGKTTLISALFRLVEPAGGRILIDEIDICSMGLKDLRMKLSIIPQEPTLFRGSIRSNLDPLSLHTDHEIWEALEKCQLKSLIGGLPAGLNSSVSDDGENWSVGQRQLLCLGRVLLRKNKILVLDEATASIDSATDAILQGTIKQEFCSCTVITIAHRVPTVTDSDMVMVLSYGKLVEYDRPSKLVENSNSYFSKLVAEYWSNCKRNFME